VSKENEFYDLYRAMIVESFAKKKFFSDITSDLITLQPITPKLPLDKKDMETNCHTKGLSAQFTTSSEKIEFNAEYSKKITEWKNKLAAK